MQSCAIHCACQDTEAPSNIWQGKALQPVQASTLRTNQAAKHVQINTNYLISPNCQRKNMEEIHTKCTLPSSLIIHVHVSLFLHDTSCALNSKLPCQPASGRSGNMLTAISQGKDCRNLRSSWVVADFQVHVEGCSAALLSQPDLLTRCPLRKTQPDL